MPDPLTSARPCCPARRDEWIKEAEKCEKQDSVETAQAIIRQAIGEGVEDEERKSQWLEDAEHSVTNEAYACARAIYARMITAFKGDESIWMTSAFFERVCNSADPCTCHVLVHVALWGAGRVSLTPPPPPPTGVLVRFCASSLVRRNTARRSRSKCTCSRRSSFAQRPKYFG